MCRLSSHEELMWAGLAVTHRMYWSAAMCGLLEHAGALCIKRGVGSGSVGVLPCVYLRQGQLKHQEIGALLGYRGEVLILAQE